MTNCSLALDVATLISSLLFLTSHRCPARSALSMQVKKYNILFVPLKGMDCATWYIFHTVFLQHGMDQLFLIGKRCDHTDTFIGIIFDKLYDLFRFPWCGIL